ncbi:AfsR/SARP family transcriptional regulator [Kitasatospora viridis]|uniref:Putative ATPase n=1 Tax=Kitasatospora viridis TaxID=281105 RepID=A0A561ULU1_9ACTN|nr:BTAD domain-containing putative transcriptional regulator [Kitasatospora viridis]TWG00332.1 putative ATPase [Kitasatospora viridis]
MHYGILGTTTARQDDGTPIALGGARLRALLTALVLRQGRPVPAEVLVAEVWTDEPPQDTAAALQTLVGRLRRTIGRSEVGSGPGGYWLTGGDSDLTRFQELTARGTAALAAGSPAEAAGLLREALGLWRGPALADLPDRAGSAVRLEAQRAEARRARIAAELALGRGAELLAELAGLCADHPLDEPLQVLGIRALRQAGRTAQALERYERVRRDLAEQLGADPGAELRALHQELLRPAEAPPTAAAPAAPALTAPAPAAPTSASPAPVVAPQAGNLKGRLTSFVGREQDLAAVAGLLGTTRLVTLTGPGGSGKTRLSVEAGRQAQAGGDWPDGVWQIELAPLDDGAAVPGAVLSALGLRTVLHHSVGEVPADPVRRIVEHCARARMLLLFDNCEHLIQDAAELVDQLLAECPQLTVLATSREPLGVPGEVLQPVEPLPDPTALRLLADRGAAARPGFAVEQDPAACAEICQRLDGLPLAIELAAARLRSLTPRQLADRLDGRFALLTGGSRVLLPRQQTLRAVVDWSWELLDDRERAVLRRLSVFAGGWTLEAAEQVCADGSLVRAGQVAELLASLVDKSLVVAGLNQPEQPRYWMLETIHEYAVERLAEVGEPDAADRHLVAYRELVRLAEPQLHGSGQIRMLGVLDREQENIRTALRHALAVRAEQDALTLVLGMTWYWVMRDFRTEARTWVDQVCALGSDPYVPGSPAAVPLDDGPLAHPLPWPEPVVQEARRQVWIYQLVSRFEGAMDVIGDTELVERAPRILEAYTPDLPQAHTFPTLLRLFACFLAQRAEQMAAMIDEAVEGCRRLGRESELAWALQLRAKMSNDQVDGLEQARRDGDEAMEIYSRLGDSWGMVEALAAQAETSGFAGDSLVAVARYRRAIELALELGAPQEVPMLQVRLGEALLEHDEAAGERQIREGLAGAIRRGQQADGAQLFGHLMLGGLYAHRGEYRAALAELDAMRGSQVDLARMVPALVNGLVSCAEATVRVRCGELEEAVGLLRHGLSLLREVPESASAFAQQITVQLLPMAASVLSALAEWADDREPARRAALLLGAHGGRMGLQSLYLEKLERERRDAVLNELLGVDEYARLRAQGRELSWEQTAALLVDF